MTSIEERLQDALQASAARVRDDRLRPFPGRAPDIETDIETGTEPGAAPGKLARRAARRQTRRTWLIPAAAAVSVLLVIGLVAAVSSGLRHPAGNRQISPVGPAGIPAYAADFESVYPPVPGASPHVVVRSTSTGAVVASVPQPVVRGWSLRPNALAAAPDDRTFYADYGAVQAGKSSPAEQVWVYRLHISGSGAVLPMTRIKGGEIAGATAMDTSGSMAVSPDGTKLAFTADTTEEIGNYTGWPDMIIVIDLRTGTRSIWQGGLYRSAKTFTIRYLSWSGNGRSLIFLGLWCGGRQADASLCLGGGSGLNAYRDSEVRLLTLSTGGVSARGGPLDHGYLLFRQTARYPVIAAALAGPAGQDLTLLVLSGRLRPLTWSSVAIYHVGPDGSPLGVDYRGPASGEEGQPDEVFLGADPSGRYVLLGYFLGTAGGTVGWVSNGTFHRLPSPRYAGGSIAW